MSSTTDFECHAGAVIAALHSRVTLSRLKNHDLDMPSATRWLLDGSRVSEEDVAFFVQQLGASEARRYGRFKRRERQRQFLLGRMLVRFAVSKLMSVPLGVFGIVERTAMHRSLCFPTHRTCDLALAFPTAGSGWLVWLVPMFLGVDIEVNDPTRRTSSVSVNRPFIQMIIVGSCRNRHCAPVGVLSTLVHERGFI